MRRPGYSLFETVLALFILVIAAVGAARMLDSAARIRGTVQDEAVALLLARARASEVRRWAWQTEGGVYHFDQVDPPLADGPDAGDREGYGQGKGWPFDEAQDRDNPRFRVQARAWRLRLRSPARDLPPFPEPSPLPGQVMGVPRQGPHQIWLDHSLWLVRVRVRWGDDAGALRTRSLSVLAPVEAPPRPVASVSVEPDKATLGPGQEATFRAVARDARGQPIADATYRFYLQSGTGNATSVQLVSEGSGAPVGDTVKVWNFVTRPDGSTASTGGRCTLKVRAYCQFREFWHQGAVLDLGDPSAVPSPGPPLPPGRW